MGNDFGGKNIYKRQFKNLENHKNIRNRGCSIFPAFPSVRNKKAFPKW